jgi:hypothetical protein
MTSLTGSTSRGAIAGRPIAVSVSSIASMITWAARVQLMRERSDYPGMHRMLGALAAGFALVAPAAVHAATPQPVPDWHATDGPTLGSDAGLAVNNGGDALLVYADAENVRALQMDASGAFLRNDVIVGPQCAGGGPSDVHAVLADDGHAVASWTCGPQRQEMFTRVQWGAAPQAAQSVVPGPADAAFPYLALAADGTAALFFRQGAFRDLLRVVLFGPGGGVKLRSLAASDLPLNPIGLGVDGHNRFYALWQQGYGSALREREFDSSGRTGRTLALPAQDTTGGEFTSFSVDAAGDQLLAWMRGPDYQPGQVVLAERRHTAAQFGRPQVIARNVVTNPQFFAFSTSAAGQSVLSWLSATRPEPVRAVIRSPDGTLGTPVTVGTTSESWDAAIAASGIATLATDGGDLRTLTPNGVTSVIAPLGGCQPEELVVAADGRGAYAVRCGPNYLTELAPYVSN